MTNNNEIDNKRILIDYDFFMIKDVEKGDVIDPNDKPFTSIDLDKTYSDLMFIKLKMAIDKVKRFYSDFRNEVCSYEGLSFYSNYSGDYYFLKEMLTDDALSNNDLLNKALAVKVSVLSENLVVFLKLQTNTENNNVLDSIVLNNENISKTNTCIKVLCSNDKEYKALISLFKVFVMMYKLTLKKSYDKVNYEKDLYTNSQELFNLLGYDTFRKTVLKSCTKDSVKNYPDYICSNCLVRLSKISKTNRKEEGVVTIGELSQAFKSKYDIDLQLLKDVGIIKESATTLKVIASGACKCKLSVYADEYENESLKMIILTGGNAIKFI